MEEIGQIDALSQAMIAMNFERSRLYVPKRCQEKQTNDMVLDLLRNLLFPAF